MPKPIEKLNIPSKYPYIALDGGVRDFLTGFTEDSIIKYGHNFGQTLTKYYKKIDTLNSLNVLNVALVVE